MKKYKFISVSYVEADSEEEAKMKFADNSTDFAANADCEEIIKNEFYLKYTPLHNCINNNAAFNGTMYETYGEEYEFIMIYDNNLVWTIIEENNKTYFIAGKHLVNKVGYIITKEKWKNRNETYLIT